MSTKTTLYDKRLGEITVQTVEEPIFHGDPADDWVFFHNLDNFNRCWALWRSNYPSTEFESEAEARHAFCHFAKRIEPKKWCFTTEQCEKLFPKIYEEVML